MTTPRIAFAIPYYDNPGYLAEAIASVQAQTVSDWELVVVDDAGPEPAETVVSALNDPRLRYVRNGQRLGLPDNWNECLRWSRAPLATLLHGDDRLLPDYASRVLSAAKRRPDAAAFYTGVRIIREDGRPTRTLVDGAKKWLTRRGVFGELTGDRGLAVVLAANFIYCPTLALRLASTGTDPFDSAWRFVADWDFTARQLLAGRSLVGIDEALLEYRRHSAQTTAQLSQNTERFDEELAFLKRMTAVAQAAGFERGAGSARRRVATRTHVAVNAGADLLRGRPRHAAAKAGVLWRDLVR